VGSGDPCPPDTDCEEATNSCAPITGPGSDGEATAIPTLNEWVMIILGLLILAVGTINIVRRRRAAMAR